MDKVRDETITNEIAWKVPEYGSHNKSWVDLLESSNSSEDSKVSLIFRINLKNLNFSPQIRT